MTKYYFQLERITLQDMRVLFALAEARSDLTYHYICNLLEKAGVDLEEVPVKDFPALTTEFMEQVSGFLSSNPFGAIEPTFED